MSAGAPPLFRAPKPQAKAAELPKCGAAITLRSFGQAETSFAGSCHSILDAKDPNLAILQQFEIKTSDISRSFPWVRAASCAIRLRSHRVRAAQHQGRRNHLLLA